MSRSLILVIILLIPLNSCENKKPDNEEFEIPVYRVSGFNNTRANEVSIAVNPVNTDNIIVGSNLDWVYYSFTGGYSWTEDNITSSAHGVWGDPVLMFDEQGVAYYCHLSDPEEGDAKVDRIVVQKSIDSGQSWDDGIGVGLNGTKVQDKEWICSDRGDSPYSGNLYMSWTEFDDYGSADPEDRSRIRFSFSDDRSASWAEPIVISDTEGDCLDDDNTMEGAVPCVDNNGNVYVAWAGPDGIYFDRSTDGGRSFGTDIIISDMPGGWAFDVPGIYRCNGMPFTVCDNSDSAYSGNIYVMWSDQRNGTDNTDIFLIRSEDEGLSWSERMMVNTDGSSSHQFFPNITVDPLTGIIYIVYYDRSETEGNATEVWLARSADGGENFQNYRITDKPFTPESDIFFGDYIDIDAYNGMIYPAWMQMSNREMSIWVARLQEDDFDKL
ncbi:MAG: sialidase family protein [Bacteroidales bacterium]|nr:sialidase family protein [Bacteroidales bacterium]